ncbi:cupin domain-containing protein [Bacillus sp. EB106-08-02-XG196]|jgi:mannose-6-phosphate isomerase-like protein (cupin superfamily)|uniref:cupin domain-containing protein n=1 Tax=Bacillus sp. EB106-08-02-XG196 TaxID=2737049 RepID=UPI0015C48603|nr:cupin domain-containing protein [Bacillus sp. EB106-08-02-XG196]NWQ42598.1 cupin domain-containing protein [Bacillus sp. EB106-08-02-XG196]
MYYVPYTYPYPYQNPYYVNVPMYDYGRQDLYWGYLNELDYANRYQYWQSINQRNIEMKDYGKQPFVVNIEEATKQNSTFRTVLWTGSYLQVTLMSINMGEDIGLEMHPDVDQFLRIEEGHGIVQMGDSKDNLTFQARVSDDFAIMVPAGKWHNVTNTGNTPLKLYSIYAPPEHPFGTVHRTKAEAMAAEENHE